METNKTSKLQGFKPVDTASLICLNCGEGLAGRYCSGCGQRSHQQRLTVPALLRRGFKALTDLDSGVWFTAVSLFRNPGKTISHYISGKRACYTNPLKYLLLTISGSVLLMLLLPSWDEYMLKSANIKGQKAEVQQSIGIVKRFLDVYFQYMAQFMALMVPFLAMCTYTAYRKFRYNYAEMLVFSSYTYGQQLVIHAFFIPFYFIFKRQEEMMMIVGFTSMFAGMVYSLYVFQSFFGGSKLVNGLKFIMVYFFSYLLYLILVLSMAVVLYQIWKQTGSL